MAAPTTEKVGKGPCPICGEGLFFRRSKGGMLCFKCENCDASGYAQPGGDAYRQWMGAIPKASTPAPAGPSPEEPTRQAPKPAPAPAPAKRVPNSVFSLGDL